jgi:hypothetical protein
MNPIKNSFSGRCLFTPSFYPQPAKPTANALPKSLTVIFQPLKCHKGKINKIDLAVVVYVACDNLFTEWLTKI